MSLLTVSGFYLWNPETKDVLTDGSKTIVFTSDNSLKFWYKKKLMNREPFSLFDYRAKGIRCRKFTRHYLVI
jgi:hypothetical protein